jgi:hypothetical protein
MSRLAKLLLTSFSYVPTVIGESFGGGYFAGYMRVAGQRYALIVAPKATGQAPTQLQGKTTGTLPASTSQWDGNANMAALVADGIAQYPAAQYCYGLSIGGFTDWALPARDQLELLYRNFKPTVTANHASFLNSGVNPTSEPVGTAYTSGDPTMTTLPAFQGVNAESFETNFYFTSSPGPSIGTIAKNFSICQEAESGSNNSRWVRAVRMVKIPG